MDLEATIADLARSGASTAEAGNQLQALSRLQRQIGSADRASLTALRTDIAAAVTTAQAVIQQGRTSADAAARADTPAERLATARGEIAAVATDYYDNKVLDPYLKFASAADEEAYRRREQANKDAIERELAKGTAEGARNAWKIMQGQLDDAEAHGAGDSPDFADLRRRHADAREQLKAAARETHGPAVQAGVDKKPASASELDDVAAALRASGVATSGRDAALMEHGLASQQPVRVEERGR